MAFPVLKSSITALVISGFALPASFGAPSEAKKNAITNAEVVTLPTYDVKADRVLPPLEKWTYVSVPGYEILSSASDANTKRFVRDFYLLQQAVQVVTPGLVSTGPVPTYIVLCGQGDVFKQFMPKDAVLEEDTSTTTSQNFITQDAERSAIVVNFNFNELSPGELTDSDLPDVDGGTNTTYRRDPFKGFYTAYFRQLLLRNIQPPPPRWMEEGLVRLLAGVQITQTRIAFEKVGGGTRISRNTIKGTQGSGLAGGSDADSVALGTGGAREDGGFSQALANRALIPLKDFFNSASDPGFSNQAYLFTYMCLFGGGKKFTVPYYKLSKKAADGPITEAVFRECFNMSFRQMETEMRMYLEFTDAKTTEFQAKRGGGLKSAPPFTLREATDAESGRIAGEVLRLTGHKDAALQRLMAPYIRGETDPELLSALGLAEGEAQHDARAQKFLDVAVKYKTTRARAYYELGRLRWKSLIEKADAEKRDFTPAELAFVAAPLKAGLQQPPAMAETHDLLVQVWSNEAATVSKEDFESLLPSAGRLSKKHLKLVFQTAELGIQRGYVESVRSMVRFGLQHSTTPEAQQLFGELAAKLPPLPAQPQPAKKS